MYKIQHIEPKNWMNPKFNHHEEIANYVMEQVSHQIDGMSFDEKDDFNLGAFIAVACKELSLTPLPENEFEVSWEYYVQIDGANFTYDEQELLKLATEYNVPDWLIYNFDDPNPVVFTYVRNDNLYGEHETKTPLIHLMNWIERESYGRYTFNA